MQLGSKKYAGVKMVALRLPVTTQFCSCRLPIGYILKQLAQLCICVAAVRKLLF